MDRLLYILIYPPLWLLSKLPFPILYLLSDFIFILVYHILGYRKKTVLNNLKLVFPDKSLDELLRIRKAFFRHFCDILVETIKAFTISEKEIKKRFLISNPDILDAYFAADRSVFLMAGHYGNWEWSGILNKFIPHQGLAVYKPLRNQHLDALVKKIRGRFGGIIASNKKIVTKLYRMHKKGINTLTYILSDQTPKLNAYKYRDTFLGVDVPMFTGTEELAKRLDFSVIYLRVEKKKRGYYEVTLVPIADNPKKYPDYTITRKFFDALENQIQERPEYYLWSHKRWKHRLK